MPRSWWWRFGEGSPAVAAAAAVAAADFAAAAAAAADAAAAAFAFAADNDDANDDPVDVVADDDDDDDDDDGEDEAANMAYLRDADVGSAKVDLSGAIAEILERLTRRAAVAPRAAQWLTVPARVALEGLIDNDVGGAMKVPRFVRSAALLLARFATMDEARADWGPSARAAVNLCTHVGSSPNQPQVFGGHRPGPSGSGGTAQGA